MEKNTISKTVKLNNDLYCPSIGLGTSHITSVPDIILSSIKQGNRLIDTASLYQNESEVGIGISLAITQNIVERSDLFIITKLAPKDRSNPSAALKKSLTNLNLSYVDLYLDHWPLFYHSTKDALIEKNPMHITWAQMENLVKEGLTKSIGVSNYSAQSLLNLLSFCVIKPSFIEIEYHPYLNQKGLKEICDRQDIRIIAYNSLVKGAYVDKFHKERIGIELLEEEIVKKMAKKYGKTPAQIVLNWAMRQGVIVIPRTSNVERLGENLRSTEFAMCNEDVEEISKLNKDYRFCSSMQSEDFDGYDYFS